MSTTIQSTYRVRPANLPLHVLTDEEIVVDTSVTIDGSDILIRIPDGVNRCTLNTSGRGPQVRVATINRRVGQGDTARYFGAPLRREMSTPWGNADLNLKLELSGWLSNDDAAVALADARPTVTNISTPNRSESTHS